MGIKEIWASLVRVMKEHHDPHGIALGVAIGAFIAVLPLYGLHTVLYLAAIFLVPRANKLSMLLGTNISIPPTIATITWTAYDVGRLVLWDRHYPPLSLQYIRDFNISRASDFFLPLFVGSIALGIILAAALYAVTWVVVRHYAGRRGPGDEG
jgi:uncharacterized protein (DUF2062 family)